MTTYILSSEGEEYTDTLNGQIRLPYTLPGGRYEVLEFIVTNNFNTFVSSTNWIQLLSQSEPVDSPIPASYYTNAELAAVILSTMSAAAVWDTFTGFYLASQNMIQFSMTGGEPFRVSDPTVASMLHVSADTILGVEGVTYTLYVDTTRVKYLNMEIVEAADSETVDRHGNRRTVTFTPHYENDLFVYRAGSHGYTHCINFTRPTNTITYRFFDHVGVQLTEHQAQWHMMIRAV